MTVEFVREKDTSATGAKQALYKTNDNRYFVVSSVVAPFTGFETLVFPADAAGEVTSYLDFAGGRGMSREEAVADLEEKLKEE